MHFICADFRRLEEVGIESIGVYSLVASNGYCVANYFKKINAYYSWNLFIPNAFICSKENRLNDVFMPVNNGHVSNLDFRIYNRWGVLIYETNNLNQGWDGRVSRLINECDLCKCDR